MTNKAAVVEGTLLGGTKMTFKTKAAIVGGVLLGTVAISFALSVTCNYPWVQCHKQTPAGINCDCKFFSCKVWGFKDGCPGH